MTVVQRFEQDYFDQNYRDYQGQNPPRKLAFYRRLVERAATGIARPRILDIGCAFGSFIASLDTSWDRCGTDVSEFAIARARQAVPGARFELGRTPEIPFEGLFDVIVALDVVEHVPDLSAVLQSVAARLAPGGHFLLVVPVYDGPTGPIIRRLDKDPTHVHKCGRRFWLRSIQPYFQLVEWWGIFRYLVRPGWYVHIPTRWLRFCAPAIAILARHRTRGGSVGGPL